LIQDLYDLDLTRTEQFWIFWAFFLAYAIKIPFLSILGKLKFTKAPAVGTMLLSGIMLKMGLYSVIRWQLPIAAVS
jgi:NADH-quinone oxidoreductase subunit M